MKKQLKIGIFPVLLALAIALFIPQHISSGIENMKNPEIKYEALNAEDMIKNLEFTPLQRFLALNEHVVNVHAMKKNKQKCYQTTVQFYTFYGIPLDKDEAGCGKIIDSD